MTIRGESETVVKVPPERVFALIDDFSRIPEWNTTCANLSKVGTGPNARGDRLNYATRERQGARASVGHFEGRIVDRRPGEKFSYVIESRGMTSLREVTIRPVHRGSRIRLTIALEPRFWLTRVGKWMMSRTIGHAIERIAAEDLSRLAGILEKEALH